MRPYSRGRHRVYPSAERALRQVARARIPLFPRCGHAVVAHAMEDGQRVCTRGHQVVIACRECAHEQASMSEPTRAMYYLGEAFRLVHQRPEEWQPLVLTWPATWMPKSQAAVAMSRSLAVAQSHSSR